MKISRIPGFDIWCILFCVLAGLWIRIDFLVANDFLIDSDEAIVGLMAKHIVEGHHIPVFYYGQHYMGSFEPMLVSLLFLFIGVGSIALKCIPLVFALIMIPICYALAYRVGGTHAGRVSALCMAIPPSTLVDWSTKSRGGFIEILFLGSAALYSTMLLTENRRISSLLRTAVIGLVLGFGWWVNNQIIFFMLPIGFCILTHLLLINCGILSVVHLFFVGCAAFFVGGLPYWIYNFQHSFVSFEMFGGGSDPLSNFFGFYEKALPILLGARRFWHTEDLFPYSSVLAGILLLLVILSSLFSLFRDKNFSLFLIMLTGATIALVFIVSSFGYLSEAPRYLLPLYPILFVLFGVTSKLLGGIHKACSPLFVLGVLGLHIASNFYGGRSIPGTPFAAPDERVERSHEELLVYLREHDIKKVRTNYWIGYRLAFESNEEITPILVGLPSQVRIPWYESEVVNLVNSDSPFVLPAKYGQLLIHGLRQSGMNPTIQKIGTYVVVQTSKQDEEFHEESRIVDPHELLEVRATQKNEDVGLMFDSLISSRWGSGAPQNNTMAISLVSSVPINGFQIEQGKWSTDYPRGLEVICRDTPIEEVLIENGLYRFYRELLGTTSFVVPLPKNGCRNLVFHQTESDQLFDWSLAELRLFTRDSL